MFASSVSNYNNSSCFASVSISDHWWLHTVLAYYLLIIPAIMVSEIKQPSGGIIKVYILFIFDFYFPSAWTFSLEFSDDIEWRYFIHHMWISNTQLLHSIGKYFLEFTGVKCIIHPFYKASTDQYPRAKGLALGSLEMIAGVAMLGILIKTWKIFTHPFVSVHCVVQVCLSGKYCNCKDIIVVDTKIPLYEPKNKLTRRPSTVKDSVSTKPEADDCNKNIYLGQIVYENFKPTAHINNWSFWLPTIILIKYSLSPKSQHLAVFLG